MPTATTLLGLLRSAIRDRQNLLIENAALRHQVAVLKRSVKRPRIEDSNRVFWIAMRRLVRDWKDCLLFVQPETVVKWHRLGFLRYWGRKSKPHRQGRPPIGWKLVYLIKRLSAENVLWGAPAIGRELRRLGHDIADSTIAVLDHRSSQARRNASSTVPAQRPFQFLRRLETSLLTPPVAVERRADVGGFRESSRPLRAARWRASWRNGRAAATHSLGANRRGRSCSSRCAFREDPSQRA
ncbi:MAG: hypothetical protein ACYTG2_19005 [Planctomycetota bacterium]|jgi:hypothetical protein